MDDHEYDRELNQLRASYSSQNSIDHSVIDTYSRSHNNLN